MKRSQTKNELYVLHHNGKMLVTGDYLSTRVRCFRSVSSAKGAVKSMNTLSQQLRNELTIVRYEPVEVVDDA